MAGVGGALGRAPPCDRLWDCAQSPRESKGILLPFLRWICFSPGEPLSPHPTMGCHPISPGLAPHTHTHTRGYKFHWRRKGKDGYFSLARGLNTQIISSKGHFWGALLAGTPAWGLQPLGSLTAEEEEEKSKVRQQCINGQSASGRESCGETSQVGSGRRCEKGRLHDGNDDSITYVRDLLCCRLIYPPAWKGDKTTT